MTGWRDPQDCLYSRVADFMLIALALLLLLPRCWPLSLMD